MTDRTGNGVRERRYLLNIGQLLDDSGGDILFREAFEQIDRERRRKVLSLKSVGARAAGAGAGLLIQKALADEAAEQNAGQFRRRRWAKDSGEAEKPVLEWYTVEELLVVLGGKVSEPCYRYGKNGKPYLADHAFLFNLSHSGDYVFCGVSQQEIGVDIQKIQGECGMRLARRFFAAPECQALEACRDEEQRRRMFFRMWVRKEAYGKLTGEGIAGAVGKCFWKDGAGGGEQSACNTGAGFRQKSDLIWEEYDMSDGYQMAVCRFRQEACEKRNDGNIDLEY